MHQKTRWHLYVLAPCTCIALGIAVFIYSTTAQSIATVHRMALALAERRTIFEEALSLQHHINDTAIDREALGHAFISTAGVVHFIELLEGLGRNAAVELEITSVTVGTGSEATGLESLALRFLATGSWKQVARFFTLIEALPYTFTVENVRLEHQSDSVWRVAIAMDVYKHR